MTRIAFCGVGATGSTAVLLCRNLDATLRLIDFDRVESKNLKAQWYVKQSVGKNKAEAMRLQLANFYGVKAESFGVRMISQNVVQLLEGCDLAVDCFDNHASRVLLRDHARANSLPLVHSALAGDGTFGLVRWDERFTADEEDVEGQATCDTGDYLPLIGLVCATLARAIQEFVASGLRHDYMVALSGVTRT